MPSSQSAADQAGTNSRKKLVSLGRPCPPWSPHKLHKFSGFEGQVYFREPGGLRQILGLGVTELLESRSKERFEDIERGSRNLFENSLIEGPGRGPQLVGGFAFTPDYLSDRLWQDFLPACFILPHFQLERDGDFHFLRINIWAESGQELRRVKEDCKQALNLFLDTYFMNGGKDPTERTLLAVPRRNIAISEPVTRLDWNESVREALALIGASRLKKIVLSRIQEIRCQEGFDISTALQSLLNRYPGCFTFLFKHGKENAFLGASPELLCRIESGNLELAALAGTIPRLEGEIPDRQNRQAFLKSSKERREHQYVVDSIVKLVHSEGGALQVPSEPKILSLKNVHHLHTPLYADGRTKKSALAWASLLHPTPALGGEPRGEALRWIDTLESQPRGWYGAPFGVVDSRSNGTFTVAIRSAAVLGSRAWLFAGAGIVEGSDPHDEWIETTWKFQPMFEALATSQCT